MIRIHLTVILTIAALTAAPDYQAAFSSWRACVATHQSDANPPIACEPLRDALRKAMARRRIADDAGLFAEVAE